MQKKTPDELENVQFHQFHVSIPVVTPPESHLTVFESQYPAVRNGHTVYVSPQVLKNVFNPAERLLAVGDPLSLVQLILKTVKRSL